MPEGSVVTAWSVQVACSVSGVVRDGNQLGSRGEMTGGRKGGQVDSAHEQRGTEDGTEAWHRRDDLTLWMLIKGRRCRISEIRAHDPRILQVMRSCSTPRGSPIIRRESSHVVAPTGLTSVSSVEAIEAFHGAPWRGLVPQCGLGRDAPVGSAHRTRSTYVCGGASSQPLPTSGPPGSKAHAKRPSRTRWSRHCSGCVVAPRWAEVRT